MACARGPSGGRPVERLASGQGHRETGFVVHDRRHAQYLALDPIAGTWNPVVQPAWFTDDIPPPRPDGATVVAQFPDRAGLGLVLRSRAGAEVVLPT